MRITKIKAGWRTASLSEQLLDGPLTEMRQRILREAQSEGLWPLTDEHWDVIHFVLDYYWKHHQSPVAVRVGRSLGMGVRQLHTLFPCGVVKTVFRLAGIELPPDAPMVNSLTWWN